MAQPTARDAVRAVAENHGACLRPIQLRRIDADTGQTESVLIPCGATLASICPPCAERARSLRASQCREGWHLETEPIPAPPAPDEVQAMWIEKRAEAQAERDQAAEAGQDTAELDEVIGDLDGQISRSGLRGKADPSQTRTRRHRSTRRRQDTPDLPRRKVSPRTVGKTYTAPGGKTFRPSMFITLTWPSYGRVGGDGTPADPASYGYAPAARDALRFAALFDRFIQNLRRYLGHEVQYFAAVEPQRRLAPHVHIAMRGTLSRTERRQVIAATYHQVWWPSADTVRFSGDHLPVWHEPSGRYLDPSTGELLATWDDALDAITDDDQPRHVARFGTKFDAQGVLAGSRDAGRCIGYLTKYLTKQLADCHHAETGAQHAHTERLAAALRYEPCSDQGSQRRPDGSTVAGGPRARAATGGSARSVVGGHRPSGPSPARPPGLAAPARRRPSVHSSQNCPVKADDPTTGPARARPGGTQGAAGQRAGRRGLAVAGQPLRVHHADRQSGRSP